MTSFYTFSKTNQELRSESADRVVFLVGSFNGYLNFGDILQLRGIIRWYKQHWPRAIICPLLNLQTITDEKILHDFIDFFETPHWLLYKHCDEEHANKIVSVLGLEPPKVTDKLMPTILHVYGGGFFNGFWGRWMLDLIESVLHTFPINRYVISGQQVGNEFASVLAEHCRRYKPDLVGCRDPISVKVLTQLGIDAFFSGDDAFEELLRYADIPVTVNTTSLSKPPFGLHLNLSKYVYSSPIQGQQIQAIDHTILQRLQCLFQLLIKQFNSSGFPVIVGSYLDSRQEVQDTWAALKSTILTRYFPQFIGLDIVGLLLQGKLEEAIPLLRSIKLFISTSYHTALFLKILGVPTYLLAFNDYYIQKQSGIQEQKRSLQEFLNIDPEILLKEQEAILLSHRKARQKWNGLLERELSKISERWGVILRGIAYLKESEKRKSVKLYELEQKIGCLNSENVTLREQLASLKEQNSDMLKKLEEQKQVVSHLESENAFLREQLEALYKQNSDTTKEIESLYKQNDMFLKEISKLRQENTILATKLEIVEQSKSWKLVQKYWAMMDRPFWRLILSPVRKIAFMVIRALNR